MKLSIEEKLQSLPGIALVTIGCIIGGYIEGNLYYYDSFVKWISFAILVIGVIVTAIPFKAGLLTVPGNGTYGAGILLLMSYKSHGIQGELIRLVSGLFFILLGLVIIYAVLNSDDGEL